MVTELTIGKLAKAAGVTVETIRYYQRRDLLNEPVKPLGGQRRYAIEQVKRLIFIKRAQSLGFTLSEVRNLLDLDEAHTCTGTRELAVRKMSLIERKISDLSIMQQALSGLVQQCDVGGGGATCPIIDMMCE